MMISGFLALSLMLAFTGVWMMLRPRRFAAACEAFVATGNLPSFLPRSVKSALLRVRALGTFSLVFGILLVFATLEFLPQVLRAAHSGPKLYWLVVPASLGLSAGYVILFYASDWAAENFGAWLDHPLVPQELIYLLTWELRVAGVAFTFFGLGAMSVWLQSLLR